MHSDSRAFLRSAVASKVARRVVNKVVNKVVRQVVSKSANKADQAFSLFLFDKTVLVLVHIQHFQVCRT